MKMLTKFYKYQGAGNDFVIFDNRAHTLPLLSVAQIHRLCDRRFGVGADGMMILQQIEGYDFEMQYFNADGNKGSMCGNGGRCMVAFAKYLNIITEETRFLASDGAHFAYFNQDLVALQMIDVTEIGTANQAYLLDTGSPHYVQYVQDIDHFQVYEQGKNIRNSDAFVQKGINVNFVEDKGDFLSLRTYERGVEDETFACGTGATAVALSHAYKNQLSGAQQIPIRVKGGDLRIQFQHQNGIFTDIFLIGPAQKVFEGELDIDEL